ncbi:MAG: D-glycero-alpha-D-manno-heptose-1,7-bisphosphate 7-phosphatase [Acidimicrobiales bacterium]
MFVDRDGVIVEHRREYVRTWSDVRFLPGALAALARLGADRPVVIVSNQSLVGRGMLGPAAILQLHCRIVEVVVASGAVVTASYICPHAPVQDCGCRKPRPGLLVTAAGDLGLSLPSSWMVGDSMSDLDAGLAAGARPVLVSTGRGRRQEALLGATGARCPVVADLAAAADLILAGA